MDRALYKQLFDEFGPGEDRLKRQRLFATLASLARDRDEGCKAIILDLIREAKGKVYPDRYFCSAVMWRLERHGYIPERKQKRREIEARQQALKGYKQVIADDFQMPT